MAFLIKERAKPVSQNQAHQSKYFTGAEKVNMQGAKFEKPSLRNI